MSRPGILNRMVVAINAHDLDAFVSLYAEHVVSEARFTRACALSGAESYRHAQATAGKG